MSVWRKFWKEGTEMREIKFKGKRIDNGEWVYGYYAKKIVGNFDMRVYNETLNDFIITQFSSGGISHVEVIPETVGQYTGLKDKNGKEIYEGDLIRSNGVKKHLYRIAIGIHQTKGLTYHYGIFTNEVKMLCGVHGIEVKSGALCFIPLVPDDDLNIKSVEIIGSIYENPELLNDKPTYNEIAKLVEREG